MPLNHSTSALADASQLPTLNIFRSPDRPKNRTRNGLVEGLFRTGEMIVLVGESNSGKSGTAVDLVQCMVRGLKWQDRKTKKSAVLYCSAESPSAIAAQEKAWNRHHRRKRSKNLFFLAEAFDLDKPAHVELFKQKIREISRLYSVCFRLLVLDTYADFLGDADENSNSHLRKVMRAIESIARELHVAVLVVHHLGKDTTKGARGGTATNAKTDLRLDCMAEAGFTALTIGKMRRGRTGISMKSFRKEIVIGKDDWGNDDTSYVMVCPSQAPENEFKRLAAWRESKAPKRRSPAASKTNANAATNSANDDDMAA